MEYKIDPTNLVIWKAGRPAEIWLSHHKLVRNFIKEYKMKPLPRESYPYFQVPHQFSEFEESFKAASPKRGEKKGRWIWPLPFPGGIRIPHFHYGADVYLVERDQWSAFSAKIVGDLRERLDQANEISFEQVLALNEAITPIR